MLAVAHAMAANASLAGPLLAVNYHFEGRMARRGDYRGAAERRGARWEV